MELKFLLILLLGLGLLSFTLTFLIRKYAVRNKMLAYPNKRSLHDLPTPTGGGIAIVISWYLGLTIFRLNDLVDQTLFFALMSGMLITIVSLLDDLFGVKPYIRLIVHFITAIIAFAFLHGLRPLIIPEIQFDYNYIVYPVAIIGIVWFINLYNFMDGIDGIASVEAIFVSSVLFVLTWNPSTMLLIVCVGSFLCWNWPKAKIFMGDTGSTQLGFILVIMGIYFHNNFEFSIINWIMLTSPFWFDATITLFRRMRNRENLSEAHRNHIYQRIVRSGISQGKLNFILIVINIFIILFIILYRYFKSLQVPVFVLTMSAYYIITKMIDRKIPFETGNKS